MNKAILLGSLFLRASSVYGGATYGDLIEEMRKRNDEHGNRRHAKNDRRKDEKNPRRKSNSGRHDEVDLAA